MYRRAALIAFSALLVCPVQAQPQTPPRAEDHLEPDGSILGGTSFMVDYDLQVRDILKEALNPKVRVHMVALPSFSPEFAVGLMTMAQEGVRPPYHILALTPVAQIWTYNSVDMLKSGRIQVVRGNKNKEIARLESSVPKNPKDLKIKRCEIGIGDTLATRIMEVWRKMLLKTRCSARPWGGADGERYYFGMWSWEGPLAGTVWSPEQNSSTGNLVELAYTMRAVCEKKNGANESQLEKLTAELEHRLQ